MTAIPGEKVVNPVNGRYRNVHGIVHGFPGQSALGDQLLSQCNDLTRYLEIGNVLKFLTPPLGGIRVALTGFCQYQFRSEQLKSQLSSPSFRLTLGSSPFRPLKTVQRFTERRSVMLLVIRWLVGPPPSAMPSAFRKNANETRE